MSKPSPIVLSLTERQTLIESAPSEPGDHVVSLSRRKPVVFGVVRRDTATPSGRLVSIGATSAEALERARPVAAIRLVDPVQQARGLRGAKSGTAARRRAYERKRAAETELRSELADYRRTVAAVAGATAKLV